MTIAAILYFWHGIYSLISHHFDQPIPYSFRMRCNMFFALFGGGCQIDFVPYLAVTECVCWSREQKKMNEGSWFGDGSFPVCTFTTAIHMWDPHKHRLTLLCLWQLAWVAGVCWSVGHENGIERQYPFTHKLDGFALWIDIHIGCTLSRCIILLSTNCK